MTLLCFASQKGSPGASAAALAIAAALRTGPGRRKLLLEADLAGGTLAIRYRLPSDPGLVTLAAAARAGLEADDLWRHAAELPGGLAAVLAPDGPDQVHAALGAAGRPLGRFLADLPDVDVICDIGRLPPGSPALDLVIESTALLMVARPAAEQLQPAARRLLTLRPQVRNVGWLLIGERPHGPAEVEDTFGLPVVGVLADDRRSVEAIEAGALTKRVRRHPFVRSAVTVAEILADWMAPLAQSPAAPGPADPVTPSTPVDPVTPSTPDAPSRPTPAAGAEVESASDPVVPPALGTPGEVTPGRPPMPRPAVPAVPAAASVDGPVAPLAPVPSPPAPAPGPRSVPPPAPSDHAIGPTNTLPVERRVGPRTDHTGVEAGPVPVPPRRPIGRPGVDAPTPFVHDDDDIEWTAS